MTPTEAPEPQTLHFDAIQLARGWLSTALAAGKDPERPALCDAVCIEAHHAGVTLVSTDGYVLLRSWVPTSEATADETTDPPGIDEAPLWTAVACDYGARGRALLAYALKTATAKDAPPMTVTLTVGPSALDDNLAFSSLEAQRVGLEFHASERVEMRTYEGPWVAWRKVVGAWTSEQTAAVALSPEILGRLTKVCALHGGLPLVWGFGGDDDPARVEIRNASPVVDGIVMPMRLTPDELERAGDY